ncbi:MAG: LicD family protein [Cloacibacillus sp.]
MQRLSENELKILHQRMLELLNEFERLCNILEIQYIAIGGTLLGAIRHHGFIPWDDDIDVALKREDYEKFLNLAARELGKEFFLQTFETDPGTTAYQAKLRLNGTLFIESSTIKRNMHQGIFLDIFPLDEIPRNGDESKKFCRQCFFWEQLFVAKNTYKTMGSVDDLKGLMRAAIRAALFVLMRPIHKKFIYYKLDTTLKRYRDCGSGKLTLPSGYGYKKYLTTSEIYPITRQEFETTTICAPQDYDVFLHRLFGNYTQLPPEKKRYGHRPYKIKLDKE